jgi:AraC-like DNA-binding protein
MIHEQCERKEFYKERFSGLLLSVMSWLAREYLPKAAITATRDYRTLQRIVPALNMIGSQFNRRLTVKLAVRECSMSMGHFRRVFREQMMKNFQAYLCDFRLNMAKNRLLQSADSISEIAFDCGQPFPVSTACSETGPACLPEHSGKHHIFSDITQ